MIFFKKEYLSNFLKKIDFGAISVVLFSGILFVSRYFSDGLRPGVNLKLGWYEAWADQGEYYNMVEGIRHGSLGNFSYPFAYPLMGYLGSFFYGKDPFFLVDLVAFVLTVFLFYKIMLKYFDKLTAMFAGCFLAYASVLLFYVPWTTSATAVCMAFVWYVFEYEKESISTGLLTGFALGLAFASRIADFIPLFVCYSILSCRSIFKNKRVNKNIFIALSTMVLIIVASIIVNYKFSGTMLGPYFGYIKAGGFNPEATAYKLYGYLVDAVLFHRDSHIAAVPLFRFSPIFVLVPLGVLYALLQRKYRWTGIIGLATISAWAIMYIPYVALTGFTLRCGSLHYIKILFPFFMFFSILVIKDTWSKMITPPRIGTLAKWIIVAVWIIIGQQVLFRFYGVFTWYVILTILLLTIVTPKENEPKQFSAIAKVAGYLILLFIVKYWFVTYQNFGLLELGPGAKIIVPENAQSARYALDKDMKTKWLSSSKQHAGMDVILDLERQYFVNNLILKSDPEKKEYLTGAAIFISKDNVSWHKISVVATVSTGPVHEFLFDPLKCRYIKFRVDENGPNRWGINEINVIGR